MNSRADMAGYGGVRAEAEFEEYVELLRLEYKRKRNFMKPISHILSRVTSFTPTASLAVT
jgi:hypothetical protein